ncbi:porin [Bradyrhizobium sp. WD16]|nr:porin [Bradyrhizobium sp. WD16]
MLGRHKRCLMPVLLGTAAACATLGSAVAADLPVKAKPVEYVRICTAYGAGFYFIPGTDTCLRIGGAIRIGATFNGNPWGVPYFQGGTGGANAYNRSYYTTRERAYLFLDTRTQTDYGVLRTYASVLFDFSQGRENISGGYTENDFLFIQFAGFTFGKAVSEFDPQWALTKPIIGTSTGALSGSHNDTGLPQLAYTAEFGNGVSGTISLEDAQPYRSAGTVNTSLGGSSALLGPFGGATIGYGTTANTFQGNAQGGDHVPDIVGNLRLDQGWGTLHVGAAAHEVHGTYYTPTDSDSSHPSSTWGYAVIGAFELKQLPTGSGDSLKVQASYGNGAAKYVFGGTWDSAGAGRLAKLGNGGMGFGYVLDGVYGTGTSIEKSDAWQAAAFYEHYWTPQWRTSLFASYSRISYGSTGDALLLAAANAGRLSTGFTTASGSFDLALAEIGTRTAWTPVKDLTLAAEFTYVRLNQHLTGTFTTTGTAIPGYPAGSTFQLKDQDLYQGAVEIRRNF